MKNSLFSGSEQSVYYSETYSEHCQTSKVEHFEKIVEGFEPFSKRSILDIWQGSGYASAADVYSSLRKRLIQ